MHVSCLERRQSLPQSARTVISSAQVLPLTPVPLQSAPDRAYAKSVLLAMHLKILLQLQDAHIASRVEVLLEEPSHTLRNDRVQHPAAVSLWLLARMLVHLD